MFGGNGLVGRNLTAKLVDNYDLIVIDISVKRKLHNVKYLFYDIFDNKKLTFIIQSTKPDLIINSVNMATICSKNGIADVNKIITFFANLFEIFTSLEKKCTYVQIGTTGSGGLGFNIPFTHGEKQANLPIINKAAIAGIITSMNLLLQRGLRDKLKVIEIKPGLCIFSPVIIQKRSSDIQIITLDGGESGNYTYNEVALLTSFMGFTSVDRLCNKIIRCIHKKGKINHLTEPNNITKLIDQAIISETNLDKHLKNTILKKMRRLQTNNFLIATGNLGPPDITLQLIKAKAQLINNSLPPSNLPLIKKNLAYFKSEKPQLYAYIKPKIDKQDDTANIKSFDEPFKVVANQLKKSKS